ncbi:protein of unknown function [Hyphomicrobium sp. 1Nfss2.1]|uniref:hypothetical protein n=1 Tax=Hyphomicrobium sp. 1Nfss2.1 TaxID=3413936 RepID=UPI003C7E9620
MAFKHSATSSDATKAGKWEVNGRVILKTKSGLAVLFHDGVGKKFLPLKSIVLEQNADGTATVWMPEWLHRKPYEKEEKARDVA